jgi:hypothetical protein
LRRLGLHDEAAAASRMAELARMWRSPRRPLRGPRPHTSAPVTRISPSLQRPRESRPRRTADRSLARSGDDPPPEPDDELARPEPVPAESLRVGAGPVSRAAITAALEALESGDTALAVRILLDAVQEPAPGLRRFTCTCGLRFEWPGQLQDHQASTGHGPNLTRAA